MCVRVPAIGKNCSRAFAASVEEPDGIVGIRPLEDVVELDVFCAGRLVGRKWNAPTAGVVMRLWDQDHPRLYKSVEGRERNSSGPFDRLAQ